MSTPPLIDTLLQNDVRGSLTYSIIKDGVQEVHLISAVDIIDTLSELHKHRNHLQELLEVSAQMYGRMATVFNQLHEIFQETGAMMAVVNDQYDD